MNNFIKQHKYLIILFILFSVIAIFSWFKITNYQLPITNEISNFSPKTDAPLTQNEQTTATSLNHNITTSQLLNTSTEKQNDTTSSPVTNHQLPVTNYQLLITGTSTVYEAMKNSELNFKTKSFSGLGEFVEEINGLKNDTPAGKYWIYYVNGESAKLGVSQQIVKPNDLIEWRYEDID